MYKLSNIFECKPRPRPIPSLGRPKPWAAAWALILTIPSLPKPGLSHSFWAEPSWNITSGSYSVSK